MPQLLNPLATKEQVARTPSRRDGVPFALEEELRVWGCQLIQQAGVLLRLPQVTMATAQVLYQRFWFVSSMHAFDVRQTAIGALFLACKLEESPKRVRDMINVFDYLVRRARHTSKHRPGPRSLQLKHARASLRRDKGKTVDREADANGSIRQATDNGNGEEASDHPDARREMSKRSPVIPAFEYHPMTYFSTEFYDAKDELVIAEMQILKRLGFQVQVNLPYAIMVNYLQLLGLTATQEEQQQEDGNAGTEGARDSIAQRAWAVLNDALQTSVYCLFPPHVLAAASIYLVSVTMPLCPPLPLDPSPWWELFDVNRTEIRIVSSHILRLYDNDDDQKDRLAFDAHVSIDEEARQHVGLAARVREEWGGMVDFCSRSAVRDWVSVYGHSAKSNSHDDGL